MPTTNILGARSSERPAKVVSRVCSLKKYCPNIALAGNILNYDDTTYVIEILMAVY